jgi:hypothetical protein
VRKTTGQVRIESECSKIGRKMRQEQAKLPRNSSRRFFVQRIRVKPTHQWPHLQTSQSWICLRILPRVTRPTISSPVELTARSKTSVQPSKAGPSWISQVTELFSRASPDGLRASSASDSAWLSLCGLSSLHLSRDKMAPDDTCQAGQFVSSYIVLYFCMISDAVQVSFCIMSTSLCTTELGNRGWSLPTTQTFFVYAAQLSCASNSLQAWLTLFP